MHLDFDVQLADHAAPSQRRTWADANVFCLRIYKSGYKLLSIMLS